MDHTNHTETPIKRLRRSRTERMLFGVCGGIGTYFAIDPVLVRVAFAVLALAQGFGLILYLVLAIIVPREPGEIPVGDPESNIEHFTHAVERQAGRVGAELRKDQSPLRRVLAWIVVVVGIAALIGLFRPRLWGAGLWHSGYGGWNVLLPLLLVFIGIYLIIRPPRR